MEEIKLNNIWLNGVNISANISKYKRKDFIKHVAESGDLKRQTVGGQRNNQGDIPRMVLKGTHVEGGQEIFQKSFIEALKGMSSTKEKEDKGTIKTIIIKSSFDDRQKFSKARVGIMQFPSSTYGVGRTLLKKESCLSKKPI